MTRDYKNKNRGYQQLRVWQDAIAFYELSSKVFRRLPYELRRVASQAIGSSDSVHRNIAEGYCRRSLREYLNFLNIALGSLGESVSGLEAYRRAEQINEDDFKVLNELAYKLENGLLKLVESLERKRVTGDWIDTLIVKETNALYGSEQSETNAPSLQYSITPEVLMNVLSTYHLKSWVEENKEYFKPPFRTNKLLVHHKDFLVMVLRGPNTRLDFHIEPGDEFFYQVEGDMTLHLKPEGERRQVVQIKEGEIFVCPGGLPHSPRRFDNTWGLVIERKRRAGEKEEFAWFCENCDELVLSRIMDPDNIPAQVSQVYQEFNDNQQLRTCRACGYVFPTTPMAERLGFLETKK